MTNVDTVIDARWVVPVTPTGAVYPATSVVVDNGLIVDVLPAAKCHSIYRAREHVELADHALIPGLVNAHTHAAMTLLRGFADDVALEDWLTDHIWPAEGKWVTRDFVWDGTSVAIAEMLLGGTTCFSDMYFFPEVAADAAHQLGMRMVAGLIVFDMANSYSQDADECISKGLALHQQLASSPLVTTAWAPHAPYTVADPAFTKIAHLSLELGIPIHTHVNETASEDALSISQYGKSQLRRLADLGAISSRFVAAHVVYPNDEGVELLARSKSHVVHCPESNMKLANGFAPVDRLLSAGINVAIGTDGAASNNDLDMLSETRTAALVGKGTAKNAAAVPAAQALEMATLGGARALGLDHIIGSITAGKQADLAAIQLADWAHMPVYNPVSHIVYATNRNQVSDVWVAGEQRVQCGKLTGTATSQLRQRVRDWATRIAPPRTTAT